MTLIQTSNIPPRHDEDIEAWTIVLDALEAALDLDGVCPHDRGVLALMHEDASVLAARGPHISVNEITRGHIPAFDDADGDIAIAYGPGGVGTLGMPCDTVTTLRNANVLTVAELRKLAHAGRLRVIRGVGPVREGEILDALKEG